MIMKRLILLCLLTAGWFAASARQPLKVACVGNSVTYGHGINDREQYSYPAQLQRLLGENFVVGNFGKSGATLLDRGHRPYTRQEEYRRALDFAADIVVIHLGLNDTDPRNWPNYRDDFVADYMRLIQSFRDANPQAQIYICRLTPIFHWHPRFKSGTRDWYAQIQSALEKIASYCQVELIDLQKGLYNRPDLLPDAIHPNAEGAGILARTIYSAITGDYGGLQMPALYSDNMVLQREQILTLTGTANTGEQVTVSFNGQKRTATAGTDGQWSVTLSPMKAGGPYDLTVRTDKKRLLYKNVLIGEVWLCSGQSNMAFQLQSAATAQQEIPRAANDRIRLFDMKGRWPTSAVEWDAAVLDSLNRLQYYHDTQWTSCTPQSAARFSAVAYYFGKMLADSLQVPVGLIHNAIGGSGTEAWIDRRTLEFDLPDILYDWRQNDMIQDWCRERASLNIQKATNPRQRHPYEPCYLYESGIEPLAAFPLKGIIWYQGESNAHNMELHEQLFPMLVKSWRNNWKEELPFYYVQLSSIDRPSWTWFRDSQRRLMNVIPNTGMAVCSDRGDSTDVHPTRKKDVGERLARWALNRTYGHSVTPSGPLFRNAEFTGDAVFLSFDYGDGMHAADDGEIRTFEVAEKEGMFYPARAEVIDGRLKVSSPKVPCPRYVRYGWQPFTRANLVNSDGLPASTFRTEKPTTHMITWTKLPDLPGIGISAPFAGAHNHRLLVAGGCNFPDKPVAEGGKKKYYDTIYTLDMTRGTDAAWQENGALPRPVAYGASVSTPQGLVCIGGNNEKSSLTDVWLLHWNLVTGKTEITPLPSLPLPMDNTAAAGIGNKVYAAGGNIDGKAGNALYCLDLEQPEKGWQTLSPFPGPARVQLVMASGLTPEGWCLFIAGGFQPVIHDNPATVSTEMLSYNPATGQWKKVSSLPSPNDGEPYTLTGGCSVALDDTTLLFAGGVNYQRFLSALDRDRQKKEAKKNGNRPLLQRLNEEGEKYLSHPVKWYKFNSALLIYNTFTGKWHNEGNYEQGARAGAGIISLGDRIILVNGELKPGIRTPQVNEVKFK